MKAFPWHEGFENEAGMELRDYFAAKAIQGLVVSAGRYLFRDIDGYAAKSYQIADAMLKARNQGASHESDA